MRKNLYLDGDLVGAAQAEAGRRQESLSDFVEIALREKLRRLAARPAAMPDEPAASPTEVVL